MVWSCEDVIMKSMRCVARFAMFRLGFFFSRLAPYVLLYTSWTVSIHRLIYLFHYWETDVSLPEKTENYATRSWSVANSIYERREVHCMIGSSQSAVTQCAACLQKGGFEPPKAKPVEFMAYHSYYLPKWVGICHSRGTTYYSSLRRAELLSFILVSLQDPNISAKFMRYQ